MITTELHLLVLVYVICLSGRNAIASRCYLCSENILAECAGSTQPDSFMYTSVLQYYTEPCNGQCVLFRNEFRSIIRGCSWTYGHMMSKPVGWHEISPGIKAYFCNSHLCNNGTYEQPEITIRRTGMINNPIILSPSGLFLLAVNNPALLQAGQYLRRRLHQCYSCTARFQGCGEFLDPRYASNYIRPCPSSCIIFRNPNDLNLITRDCSSLWPHVHAKSGLQRLLDSDAFFCQESLCNGISFDFIMGIFLNQLPTIITFPPVTPHENVSIPTTTTSAIRTTVDIYNDSLIWDDPDLDDALVETTSLAISNNMSTSSLLVDHSDLIDEVLPSSTTLGGLAIAESNSSLNWWDFNDTSLSSSSFPSTSISSTIHIEDDDWPVFNTSSILPITRYEHLSLDNDTDDFFSVNTESDSNEDIRSSTLTIPSIVDNHTQSLLPYHVPDHKIKELLSEYVKPFPTLAIPPFSWMLNLVNQNKTEVLNSTTTITTTTTMGATSNVLFEYCKSKQCHHDGRLNSDCLCICLPAFTGENCETVLCDQEPVHICAFILEHECQTDHIRYLCPRFCQLKSCSSETT